MSRYRERERDLEYMGRVKALRCLLADVEGAGPCGGAVEADHAGTRAFGLKAPDDTCIPLCTVHHRDRTDMRGFFRSFDRWRMRQWCDAAVEATRGVLQRTAASSGEIPW